MATAAQLVELARRHQTQVLAVRDRTPVALGALWRRLVTDPSEASADRWVAAATPVLQAAQLATAAAGLAYVALYVEAAGVAGIESDLVAGDFTEPRGVPASELLQRPIVTLRTALSTGRRLADALAVGGQRVAQIATTDPMLAYRAATSAAMAQNPAVVGFRRVPDGKACQFCLLASTQRYRDVDLMPLHPQCGCTVAPIVGTKDPGQILDRQTLERLRSEGVLDDITRRRRAQAEREITQVADGYRAKAAHWREQAANATDREKKARYTARAERWDMNAKAKAGELDAPPALSQREWLDDMVANPRKYVTVHQHGELGPTLYAPGHHFDAA